MSSLISFGLPLCLPLFLSSAVAKHAETLLDRPAIFKNYSDAYDLQKMYKKIFDVEFELVAF